MHNLFTCKLGRESSKSFQYKVSTLPLYNTVVLAPKQQPYCNIKHTNYVRYHVIQSLLIHLDSLGLSCCPVPIHLFNPEEDEDDDIEGFDNDEFFQRLAGKNLFHCC